MPRIAGRRCGISLPSPPRAAPAIAPAKLLERLKDPGVRARIKKEFAGDHPDWENLFFDCGGAAGILISSVDRQELKQFEGKTLDDVAMVWKKAPEDALMDFVLADGAQTAAISFMASEDDIRTGLS